MEATTTILRCTKNSPYLLMFMTAEQSTLSTH